MSAIPSIPGQRLSATTRLIALLGSPVSHSRSPAMQNGAFSALGLDFAYLAFDVPFERAAAAIDSLRTLGIRGANVTMPLKRAVCPFLDVLSPAAQMAGAVNVIVNDDGLLTGHITDGVGYRMSLEDAGVDVLGQRVVIAGAGGAGTAVAIELAMQGVASIDIFNSHDDFFADAEKLAERLRTELGCDVHLRDLADIDCLTESMRQAGLFVNATPLGMEASSHCCVLPDDNGLHPALVVTDLVYVPADTVLLQRARAAGCRTVSGLGMQLFQAVDAFRMWTGLEMPVPLAREILFGNPSESPQHSNERTS